MKKKLPSQNILYSYKNETKDILSNIWPPSEGVLEGEAQENSRRRSIYLTVHSEVIPNTAIYNLKKKNYHDNYPSINFIDNSPYTP